MTGSEIKRQVMGYVPTSRGGEPFPLWGTFASCVVLTPEEREMLLVLVQEAEDGLGGNPPNQAAALALLTPDPKIFAPRDPHTYVTHEPESSGAGDGGTETGTAQPPSGQPAPDDIGPLEGDDHYLDGVPEDVHKQTGGPC